MAVNFFDQFNIQTDKPIDVRQVVADRNELIDPSSYTNGLYAYKGMIVTVLVDDTNSNLTQTYRLDSDKTGYTDINNWVLFGGAGSIADLSDVVLSGLKSGDVLVYDPDSTDPTWRNVGPIVQDVTAGSQDGSDGIIIFKTDGSQEFIAITESGTIGFATETTAGTVELSNITDIRNANDTGVSGATKVTKPSDIRQFVWENGRLVSAPIFPTDAGELGDWSYDDFYLYLYLPDSVSGGNSWRRTRLEKW